MITRRINGKWCIDFRSPEDNRRHRIQSPENTKKGAEAYRLVLQQKMARGQLLFSSSEPSQETFNEFCREWFKTYVLPTNRPSEVSTKESILRVHLLPWFGTTLLKNISIHQVEQYKAEKIKIGLAPKTVNNHLAILAKSLRSALDWDKIEKMPKINKLRAISQRLVFFSPLETKTLIQDKNDPMWNDMILLALRTGMRFGELLGLEWDDVDLKRRTLSVTRSLVRGVLGAPKNGRERHIKMSRDVHEMLSRRATGKGRVFRLESGSISYRMAANALHRICKRAGVKIVSWHVLRHTFASTLVAEGVPLPVVQQLLGHASIVMTMKYAHLAPSAMSDAIDVLERAEMKA